MAAETKGTAAILQSMVKQRYKPVEVVLLLASAADTKALVVILQSAAMQK